jgi:hypothetical protein
MAEVEPIEPTHLAKARAGQPRPDERKNDEKRTGHQRDSRGGPKGSTPDKHGGSGTGRQQGGSGVGRER